jgi:hypothetical protein
MVVDVRCVLAVLQLDFFFLSFQLLVDHSLLYLLPQL